MKKVKAQGEAEILVTQLTMLLDKHPLPAVLASLKLACIRHAKTTLLEDKARTKNGDSVRTLLDFSERIKRLEDSAGLKNDQTRDAYIKAGGRLPSRTDKKEERFSKFTDEDRRKAEREELGDDDEEEIED